MASTLPPEPVALHALTQLKGVGVHSARKLVETFGSAALLWDDPKVLLRLSTPLYNRLSQFLEDRSLLDRSESLLTRSLESGIQFVTLADEAYPPLLKAARNAPLLLFYRGSLEVLHRSQILSIVGTRKPSAYGVEATQSLVNQLAQLLPTTPPTIVSGLAFGIDVTAHRAALDAGLPTAAVLAHGLHMIYPSSHESVARTILARGGCLLSEYVIGVKPERAFFVARNRLIALLSHATLVAQSGLRGGSLITAHIAFDNDRMVYALPGRLADEESSGCNELIYRDIAKIITSGTHLAQDMSWLDEPGSSPHQLQKHKLDTLRSTLDSDSLQVLDYLIAHPDGASMDELCAALQLPIDALPLPLFLLEAQGVIKRTPIGTYSLIR